MTSVDATPHPHEQHRSQRAGWLRAAVLGVNDGIVSTAGLMIGVANADSSKSVILTAGIAGLTAGALSMAIGEYVSVSSQRDAEDADIAIERRSLDANPQAELAELARIYEKRGLTPDLAQQVAQQLHDHDAVAAHARDELGIDHQNRANPVQAAVASAVSFSVGALIPIVVTFAHPRQAAVPIFIVALVALAISGAVGAFIGGGHRLRAAARVLIGGGIALAITALIGHLIGHSL